MEGVTMGILQKLFKSATKAKQGKKNISNKLSIAKNTSDLDFSNYLSIHPDVVDLIWIGDGEKKNFVNTPKNETSFSVDGATIKLSYFDAEEPSLIYTKLPIRELDNIESVPRPPYYPSYKELMPEQRWIYLNFLSNPYNGDTDIGYVFILYYGLERHLLYGNFEKAFRVIMKLRDVYNNTSFQYYSSNALILMCVYHQRPDLAKEFLNSLDKDYELNISINLYLMLKISFGLPLTISDIMGNYKAFEFTNNRYIKNYPDMFKESLEKVILEKYSHNSIYLEKYFNNQSSKKIKKESAPIFANISIKDNYIDIPSFIDLFKFKKDIYDLLEKAHENVKSNLATLRKNGIKTTPANKQKKSQVLTFDENTEQELLLELENTEHKPVDRHFTYIKLQDFYYKYRNLDKLYLEKCIKYCLEDIESLKELNNSYIEENIKRLDYLKKINPNEYKKEVSKIKSKKFEGNIPAFKRLSIIYEKEKNYEKAINICQQAIAYGQINNGTSSGFPGRIEKLKSKLDRLENK